MKSNQVEHVNIKCIGNVLEACKMKVELLSSLQCVLTRLPLAQLRRALIAPRGPRARICSPSPSDSCRDMRGGDGIRGGLGVEYEMSPLRGTVDPLFQPNKRESIMNWIECWT